MTCNSGWVVGLPMNRHLIMVFIALIYLAGGSFLDDLAFMILATPIFFPAVVKLGFDPLWFGMLIAVTVMIGVIYRGVCRSWADWCSAPRCCSYSRSWPPSCPAC